MRLSIGQEALYFEHQANPYSFGLNESTALVIHSRVDVAVLRRALQSLVERHDNFRVNYRIGPDGFEAVIHSRVEVDFQAIPAAGLGEAGVNAAMAALQNRQFNLEHDRLFCARLWSFSETDHRLLLLYHHLTVDGWSFWNFLDELRTIYAAESAGLEWSLPAPGDSYESYVAGQELFQRSAKYGTLEAYWKKKLAGATTLLDLPVDHPRPAHVDQRGDTVSFTLEPKLYASLNELVTSRRTSLYTLLVAAYQVLLHRYTGQDDVLVSSPVPGRADKQWDRTVGYFVNQVVLRGQLSGEMSFEDYWAQVRATIFGALKHSAYPYAAIVRQRVEERDPSRQPLTQAFLVFQKSQVSPEDVLLLGTGGCGEDDWVDLGGLRVRGQVPAQKPSAAELGLILAEARNSLRFSLAYQTALFKADTIQRMAEQFCELLRSIARRPTQAISELNLVPATERQEILERWSAAPGEYPSDRTLADLFAEQTQKHPDAVALVAGGKSWTYATLTSHAVAQAVRLRECGIAVESRVGLLTERSPMAIAGILGIVRAGAAYVPLDPAYPREQLEFILDDAGCDLILAAPELLQRRPELAEWLLSRSNCRIVHLPDELPLEAVPVADMVWPAVRSSNLAYIIFTSGTTGRPKGVAVTQQNVVRLVCRTNYFDAGPDDAFLQLASLSFDAATFEIWGSLLNGSRLVVPPPGLPALPELGRLISEERVSLMFITTALFHRIVEEGLEDWAGVRVLLTGGEVLDSEHARHFMAERPECRLSNIYGPTENTTFSTWHDLHEGGMGATVPIGRPIAHSSLYILDEHFRLVPVGVPGELFVGGDGLARGYSHRPDLTAERFVPDPVSGTPGARLYRTGDRARYRPDGTVEFLGRLDHQVKVRGFRIELDGIETILRKIPGVGEAMVLVREEGAGNRRLVAFVTSRIGAGAKLDVAGLRETVAQKLPAFMVPSAFILLPEFPLSPTGKVDRKALLAMEVRDEVCQPELARAPRSANERILASIWSEVLRVPEVGIDDNFFALGGDSILVLSVVARAQAAGLTLSVRDILDKQTIAAVAEALESGGAVATPVDMATTDTGEVVLNPTQRWFFQQYPEAPSHWNMGCRWQLSRRVPEERLWQAVQAVVAHHSAFRTRFQKVADKWTAHYTDESSSVELERMDGSGVTDEELDAALHAAERRAHQGLNLENGPLVRVVLLDGGGRKPDSLVWAIHHVVVDGVSWRLLFEDLNTALSQLEAGHSITLSPARFSANLWARQLAAWGKTLVRDHTPNEALPVLQPLPQDTPCKPEENCLAQAETVRTVLTRDETSALLRQLPQMAEARVQDALAYALTQVVTQAYALDGLWVNVEGHGREAFPGSGDLSRVVGWFTLFSPTYMSQPTANGRMEILLPALRHRMRESAERAFREAARRAGAESDGALPMQPEVSFNYLGQWDSGGDDLLLRWVDFSLEEAFDPASRRAHWWDVAAWVRDGQLEIAWTFCRAAHHAATVRSLLQRLAENLRTIANWCSEGTAFSLAGLDAPTLTQVRNSHPGMEALYPLAPLQEGILFHSVEVAARGIYHEQFVFDLEGRIEPERLRHAWEKVVHRHAILRTGFLWQGVPQPLQWVASAVAVPFTVLDWSASGGESLSVRLEAFLTEDRSMPFDLQQPPLYRYYVIRQSEDRWYFVWSFHHILLDGWSVYNLLKDLVATYAGEAELRAARPYRDYIAWLQQQDTTTLREFWQGRLAGYDEPLILPVASTSSEKTTAPVTTPGVKSVVFDVLRSRALQQAARRYRVTLNTLVQAAWAFLLSRYSQRSDVVFGVTTSGRPDKLIGVEAMNGLFINSLPLRVKLESSLDMGDWLRAIQSEQFDLFNQAHASLAEIASWSDLPPGSPLFETLLVFENYTADFSLTRQLGSWRVANCRVIEPTNYPLWLQAIPDESLALNLVYDVARVAESTAARMAGELELILETLVRPDTRFVADLQAQLTKRDREQVVSVEPNTELTAKTMVGLFADSVEKFSSRVAVECEEVILTYAELDQRSTQLAHRLVAAGVRRDMSVGLLVERSPEALISILAIMKAGGAYVPLSPDYPAERLDYLVRDAEVRVVVTTKLDRRQVSSSVIWVDVTDAATAVIDSTSLELPMPHPVQMAYIIYTSGSTGKPKGVMVSQGNLTALAVSMAHAFRTNPDSRMLQLTALTFDVSGAEIYTALVSGSRLIVPPRETLLPGTLTAELMERSGATHLSITPSGLSLIPRRELPALEAVIVGGEAFPPVLADRWRGAHRLVNIYGPTEITVWATTAEGWPSGAVPPIGRALEEVSCYLVDTWMRPIPCGACGEICIGGAGVTRGYRNRPDLTADRFVPDPFSPVPGARMYRTGDLGRWREDGQLEFLGRIDQQIKIHGHRIEPGEIEELLLEHADVTAAAVIPRQNQRGEMELVAYLTVRQDGNDFRQYLEKQLPSYMVPAAFVVLAHMPLTSSGKIDRLRLREMPVTTENRTEGVAPETPMEQRIATVWCDMLQVKSVGRHDHFFALGGHSLLAIRIIGRLHESLTFDIAQALRGFLAHPVLSEFASMLESLCAQSADAGANSNAVLAIRHSDESSYPLSFAQEQLWFVEQMDPGNAAYNLPLVLRLQGRLDRAALECAIMEMTRRHAALRTGFQQRDESVLQVVEEKARLQLEVTTLVEADPLRRYEEAIAQVRTAMRLPFDLRQAPLQFARLYPVSESDHILLVQFHHIISDGWSLGIYQRELASLYAGFAAGRQPDLPLAPIQYGDFAVWQREQLSGERLEELNGYWLKQLDGAQTTELPCDHVRPPVQTFVGASHVVRMEDRLLQRLRELARTEKGSLFTVLLAAFNVLLHRYSRQEDILVGSPHANRMRPEMEGVIGCFVNMLVLRTRLSTGMSFRELLATTREMVNGAFAHQELPFEKLVNQLGLERDLSQNPLIQVVFALQNAGGDAAEWDGLEAQMLNVEVDFTRVDLECHVRESNSVTDVFFIYNTALFEAETIERLARHWMMLLESIVDSPETAVGRLSMMDGEERQRMLGWAQGVRVREHPAIGSTLAELLASTLREEEGRPAVESDDGCRTHLELHAEANQLAHLLVEQYGIEPERRVGVLMGRSLGAVTAFLAILKAGGVYVPLDPEYPAERLEFLAGDAGLDFILTGGAGTNVALSTGCRLIPFNEMQREAMRFPTTPLPPRNRSDHAAYIIYTSGTTGRPKGVVVPHAGAVNTVLALGRDYGLCSQSRFYQFASLSFDASIIEMAGSLAFGATLVIGNKDSTAPGEPLGHFLRERRITHVQITPSALAFLPDRKLPDLKLIVSAGEKLPQALASRWRSQVRMLNAYGPTEVSVCATVAAGWGEEVPPIGYPIPNADVYVLDEAMQPVSVGVTGEIYVGGVGVTRGYLGRPDLTAERFVPDPYSDKAGARLYRTGDLARWQGDGQLDFLGRADGQFKLRGFRIESGEIDSELMALPGVRDAAVVVVGSSEQTSGQLIGFVSLCQAGGIAQPELWMQVLRQRLPAYMVPNSLQVIDEMPRTPNGKIDRQQLARRAEGMLLSKAYSAPSTEMERRVAAIWAEALGVQRVGREDSFFALGGHSLLATRVLVRLQETTPLDVATVLKNFFRYPTLAAFSASLEVISTTAPESIPTDPHRRIAPLSFAQQRLWFLNQLFPGDISYNVPLIFRLRGAISEEAVGVAVQKMVDRHAILRTRLRAEDGGATVQEIASTLRVNVRVSTFAKNGFTDAEVWANHYTSEFIREPFDLQEGPLLKVRLLHLGEGEYRLVCNIHHIIFDGWSAPLFIRELLENLDRALGLQPVDRPALAVQYADFAAWERQPQQETRWLSALDYWRECLRELPPLELPCDHPRRATPGGRAGRHFFDIPQEVIQSVEELVRASDASTYMGLLAAFQFLLGRWSGQKDFAVGTAVANRNQKEVQELIGFFVNSLVLRADLSGRPTFRSLLDRVRTTLREAFAHQELPFERLVEELHPSRELYNPLFQVVCVLQQPQQLHYAHEHFQADLIAPEVPLARVDIELHLFSHDRGFSGGLVYDRDLFEPETIEHLTTQYVRLLREMVSQPDRPLEEIELFEGDERRHLNAMMPSVSEPLPTHFVERFSLIAAQQGNRVALEMRDRKLTYRELDQLSDRMAQQLRKRGVGPEVFVGVMMDRRIETVAVLLSIWKAGGAYVPLDRNYPSDRLAFIVQDVAMPLIVTDGASMPAGNRIVEWVDVAALQVELPEPASQLPAALHPGQAAYVIYTSGSTGQPKGVVATQAGLCASMAAQAGLFSLSTDSAMLQNASLNFDASVLEIFAPLWSGSRLVIPEKNAQIPGPEFFRTLQRHRVTHFAMTPSSLASLPQGELPDLRVVICGGEALPPQLIAAWGRGREMFNAYGPTEATICVTCAAVEDTDRRMPIGRPLRGVQIYLLDETLRPVPVGARGELYIGGALVTRGYLNRPDVTAACFLPDPFSEQSGARMYRTGDLGRWRPDGQIDFLGRRDDQVKVRGFRIELGEIEAALYEHGKVKEAIVLLRDNARQEQEIAAYVAVSSNDSGMESDRVEEWKKLYDDVIDQTALATDPELDIVGWNSSYTGQPLPAEEMREWRDLTVAQILALEPRRVLEIGCGTGLLLLPVAAQVERYCGVDFSSSSLRRLHAELHRRGWSHVRLLNRRANELEDLSDESFDLLVINSVIQYFPCADYLLQVLAQAMERLPDGACIFLGDVRNLELLPVQHASVEFANAPDDLTRAELARRVQRKVESETELSFSPEWFTALPEQLSRVRSVDIRWRRMTLPNELAKFRYDVMLRIGGAHEPVVRSHESLECLAQTTARELARDMDVCRWQANGRSIPAETVGEFRRFLDANPRLLNETDLLWMTGRAKQGSGQPLVNNPLQSVAGRQLQMELRRYLEGRLPAHMVPSTLCVLDSFPLNRNGKVDRERLRAIDEDRRDGAVSEPPATEMERLVAGVWAELLQVDSIGRRDNFFTLGGHSLLAMRVIARLQDLIAVDVSTMLQSFFARPTLEEFARELEPLSRSGTGTNIVPAQTQGDSPLSYAQQRLWFLEKLFPGQTAYQSPFGLRLTGDIPAESARRALQAIVDRHSALRTVFATRDGQAVQRVLEKVSVPFTVRHWNGQGDVESWLQEQADQFIRTPIDLERDPLVKALWFELSDKSRVLLCSIHHIAFDGWSAPIFLRELLDNLDGLLGRGMPERPALAIQYRDYAEWERSPEQEERWGASARDWRELLADCESLRLPLEGEPSGEAGRQEVVLSREVSAALRDLGQHHGASLFMTLLAGFDVLLGRWSGQERFVVGTGMANRNQKELQELIGFFVNSLALPVDLSGRITFRELLTRTRDTVRRAFVHQEMPFERLVQELQPERTLRNPLFQVVFLLQESPPGDWHFDHFAIEPLALNWTTTRMDLELHLHETSDGIRGVFYYDRSLFSAETVERLACYFELILKQVTAMPDRLLSEVTLLDDGEHQRLTQEWNHSVDLNATPSRTVLEVFAETVRRCPEHVAVQGGTGQWTYTELDEQSNRLARWLVARGVGPESRVALLLGRRPEAIVAMLAVLKAGGAYVPLDEEHPAERLRGMIEDSAPSLVLVDEIVFAVDCEMVRWSDVMRESGVLAAAPVWTRVTEDNLAYLIFTSGSTGKPKGVGVTHGNLGHAAEALAQAYAVQADSSVVQLAAFTFDASVAEIFMAFAAGARLVIPSSKEELVGKKLSQLLKRERVTHLQITPSALALLPVETWPELRAVIVVGEAFPKELAEAWCGAHRLINGYGPTEGSICATCSRDWAALTLPPIGKPIARVDVYVLDEALRPVPTGTPGEIYIGGAGVARGYWQRPELTAERFIPSPYGDEAGARLYRTGDRGRWRSDGQLEFLGRVDDQVKIRGQRIELGEITTALLGHTGVREAVVRVVETEGEEASLAAYVVPAAAGEDEGRLHVSGWEKLYDRMMGETEASAASTFNIHGWNSVYTGGLIPAETMQAWQHALTQQILAFQPRRVLEIGCGSGLMLLPVAPHCKNYFGTDISQKTLDGLERLVRQQGLDNVCLRHCPAHEWSDFTANEVDTVVMNSVVQYFPSLEYLRQVLAHAVRVISPGGRLFIGDVRSYELLETMCASVELFRAGDHVSREELHRCVASRVEREEELLISPAFFRQLPEEMNRISRVEIRLRGGEANELSKFRYDVVLHIDTATSDSGTRQDWSTEVEQSLVRDEWTARWLRREAGYGDDIESVAGWRQQLATVPERFSNAERERVLGEKPGHSQRLANDPLQYKMREQLADSLRVYLQQKLPTAMVPSYFLVLDHMPLTVAGKIDVRRLPMPLRQTAVSKSQLNRPRHPMEDLVAATYAEVLGLSQVGVADNFFELGGHSLLAYALLEKLRQRTGRELPLAQFFTAPTVEQVAANLLDKARAAAWSPLVPIQTSGKKMPFFCVAPIMGTVFPYFELARQLGTDQPFYGLQPRGLDGKEPPHSTLEAMAGDFVEAIRTVQAHGPYRLGGWSFGAPVAFEVARQLEALGETVAVVVSLDGALPTPGRSQPAPIWGSLWWSVSSLLRQIMPYVGDYFYLLLESARSQRKQKAVRRTWAEWLGGCLGRLSGKPVIAAESRLLLVEQPLWKGMIAVFRANLQAMKRYRPVPISAPLVLFCSTGGPVGRTPLESWQGMSLAGIEEASATGEHLTMLRSPHVEGLAKQLRQFLDAATVPASETSLRLHRDDAVVMSAAQ